MIIKYDSTANPISYIIGISLFVLFFIGMFYVSSWLFQFFEWATYGLLIGALVLDYKVVLNHGKYLVDTLVKSYFLGIILILFNVIVFPFVVGWLFFRALLSVFVKRSMRRSASEEEATYTEYEVIDTEVNRKETVKKNHM